MGTDGGGRDRESGGVVAGGAIEVAAFPKRIAPAAQRQRRVWKQGDRLVQIGKRSVQVSLEPPHLAAVAERAILLRIDQQRVIVIGNRLVELVLVLPDQRPVDEGFRGCRVERARSVGGSLAMHFRRGRYPDDIRPR